MNEEPVSMEGLDIEWLTGQVGPFLQARSWAPPETEYAVKWMMFKQNHKDYDVSQQRRNLTEAQAKVILTMCRVTYPPKGEP